MNKPIYKEVLRMKSWFVWIFTLGFAALIWYGFIQQIIFGIPFGDKPAPDGMMYVILIIFGIALPLFFLFLSKLEIKINEDGVFVRYMPFHLRYKKIPFHEIETYEIINYSPVKDFGGWGVRFNTKGEKGYITGGSSAIKLQMKYDTLVISTRKPDELQKAMNLIMKKPQ